MTENELPGRFSMSNRSMTDKALSRIEVALIEAMDATQNEKVTQALDRVRRLIVLRVESTKAADVELSTIPRALRDAAEVIERRMKP